MNLANKGEKKDVTRFIFLCLFVLLFWGFVVGVIVSLADIDEYRECVAKNLAPDVEDGFEQIVPIVNDVIQAGEKSILIIGDSVCNQMFRNPDIRKNTNVCYAGTNAALTIEGQYILVHEFLSHESAEEIYLLILPLPGLERLDYRVAYQYFVGPMIYTQLFDSLPQADRDEIENIFGKKNLTPQMVSLYERNKIARKMYLSTIQFVGRVNPKHFNISCDWERKYLKMIQDECKQAGVTLHVLPCPCIDSEADMKSIQNFCEKYKDFDFVEEYEKVNPYLPEELFRDGLHFKDEICGVDFYMDLLQSLYGDEGTKLIRGL